MSNTLYKLQAFYIGNILDGCYLLNFPTYLTDFIYIFLKLLGEGGITELLKEIVLILFIQKIKIFVQFIKQIKKDGFIF